MCVEGQRADVMVDDGDDDLDGQGQPTELSDLKHRC